MNASKIALFARLLRQLRAGAPARSILMYAFIHCGSVRGACDTSHRLHSHKNHDFGGIHNGC